MTNPIAKMVLWVTFVQLASSLTLVSVACNSSLTLLAAAPSASLVELCDFGNQQVAIASNSTVVLRSTVLGGVLIVATAGGIIENVSLTLVNCSMVGLADPTYPFMGTYGDALISNVAISLQDTVLRRNNVSLQSSSSEGGALSFARCAVTQLVIVVSGSQIIISQLASLPTAFQFSLTHYESVQICFERSTIELKRSIAGDLSVMRIEGGTLNAVNVSVSLLASSVSLLSLVSSAGIVLRLYTFLFYYGLASLTSVQFMADGSQVSIGSQVSDEFVPRWVSFLDVVSDIHANDDIRIQNCSFSFRGTESGALISIGNTMLNSTVFVFNISVVSGIYNLANDVSSSKKFVLASAKSSESTLFEIVQSFLEVRMAIGGQDTNASIGTIRVCRVALLAFSEARTTTVNMESTWVSIYTPPQREVSLGALVTNTLYLWMFLLDAEQGNVFDTFRHDRPVVSIRRCHISSAFFVPECSGSPTVLVATGIAVFSPASAGLNIVVQDSSVIAKDSTFAGASSVLRFATVVAIAQTQLFGSTWNASVLLGNVTVDASQLDEFVAVSAMQLPPTMNASVIAVSNVRLLRALAPTIIAIILCGDNCVVLGSTFTIVKMSTSATPASPLVVSDITVALMHATKFLIDSPSPRSLLLSSCGVSLDKVTVDLPHSGPKQRFALLPSTVRQQDATTWSLRACTISGYWRLFNSSPSAIDVSVTIEGCNNMWDGRPLLLSDVGAARSALHVVQGDEPVGGRHCERLAVTVSLSLSDVAMQPKAHSIVRTLASVASFVGGGAAIIASVSTVSSSLQFLSQQAWRAAACAGDDDGSDPPFSDVASNPLQLSFDSLGSELMSAGGCIVSSVVVALVYFMIRSAGVAVERRVNGAPWDAMAVLQVPGSLYGPTMLVVQPVVASATALAVSPHRSAGSVVLGVVAMSLMSMAPCSYFCWNAIVPWRRSSAPLMIDSVRCTSSNSWIDLMFTDRFEWRCVLPLGHVTRVNRQMSMEYLARFGEVLRAFRGRRQWYSAVEVSFGILSGVLSGAVAALPMTARCSTVVETITTALQGVLLCLAAIGAATLRPYNAVVGNVLAVGNAVVALVSLVLASSTFGDVANNASNALTFAQACCCILVAIRVSRRLVHCVFHSGRIAGGTQGPQGPRPSLKRFGIVLLSPSTGAVDRRVIQPMVALNELVVHICQSQQGKGNF